jgi:hypothetical protein
VPRAQDSERCCELLVNPIIYAEVSVGYDDIEALDAGS